jgi:hypothetical protein
MKNYYKILNKQKWYRLCQQKQPIFLASITAEAMVKNKFSLIPYYPKTYCNWNFAHYVEVGSHDRNIQDTTAFLKKDIKKSVLKLQNNFKDESRKLDSFNPKELNEKNIILYSELIAHRPRLWYEITIIDGALSHLYPLSLPPSFTLKGKTYNAQGILVKTALPKKLFPMIKERMDLLKIAIKHNSVRPTEKDLAKHVKEYSWLNSLGWWDELFDRRYFLEEMERLALKNPKKILVKLEMERKNHYREAKKLLEELKRQYPLGWQYIDIIRELTDLKEENWDIVCVTGARLRPLFEKTAKKYGLSYIEFMQLTPHEMAMTLKDDAMFISKKELIERMDNFLIISSKGKEQEIVSGARLNNSLLSLEGKSKKTTTT